jgi:hypothetical protein
LLDAAVIFAPSANPCRVLLSALGQGVKSETLSEILCV